MTKAPGEKRSASGRRGGPSLRLQWRHQGSRRGRKTPQPSAPRLPGRLGRKTKSLLTRVDPIGSPRARRRCLAGASFARPSLRRLTLERSSRPSPRVRLGRGPAWGRGLLFSNIPRTRSSVRPPERAVSFEAQAAPQRPSPDVGSNGLAFDRRNRSLRARRSADRAARSSAGARRLAPTRARWITTTCVQSAVRFTSPTLPSVSPSFRRYASFPSGASIACPRTLLRARRRTDRFSREDAPVNRAERRLDGVTSEDGLGGGRVFFDAEWPVREEGRPDGLM
jgi:hypothetical protein